MQSRLFTDLEQEDQGGLPVNSPNCMVLDQSVNHTWKNLKSGLDEKFQKRKASRRTNGGFVNDVLSSWEEMKIEHIQNAIDIVSTDVLVGYVGLE